MGEDASVDRASSLKSSHHAWERVFGAHGIEPETLYRAVNKVEPSLIRVEADEAAYGLHVVLRFELSRSWLSKDSKCQSSRRLGTRG